MLTDGCVRLATIDPTERAGQQALHLVRRPDHGVFDRVGEVGDHDRLHTRRARLEQTSLVGAAAVLLTIFVTEMDLDSCQPILEAPERSLDRTWRSRAMPLSTTSPSGGDRTFLTFELTSTSEACDSENATFTMSYTTENAGYGPNESSVVASVTITG